MHLTLSNVIKKKTIWSCVVSRISAWHYTAPYSFFLQLHIQHFKKSNSHIECTDHLFGTKHLWEKKNGYILVIWNISTVQWIQGYTIKKKQQHGIPNIHKMVRETQKQHYLWRVVCCALFSIYFLGHPSFHPNSRKREWIVVIPSRMVVKVLNMVIAFTLERAHFE